MIKLNNNPLLFLGDVHGRLSLKTILADVSDVNVLHVGDLAVGFELSDHDELDEINSLLVENSIHFYSIRGNHDVPSFFDGRYTDTERWPNIHLLEDYTVLESNSKKILCVGGAVSVDRVVSRKLTQFRGRTMWFRDEVFKYDEDLLADILGDHEIDVVVTHTAPYEFEPFGGKSRGEFPAFIQNFFDRDSMLFDDLKEERELLSKFREQIGYVDLWVYGHFHRTHEEYVDDTKTRTLNKRELWDANLDRL